MHRHPHPGFWILGLLATFLLASACAEPAGPEPDVYDVRGIIRQLPAVDQPGSELFLQHEAIPDFRNIEGTVQGMDSMTMPFPVALPSELEGLAVGDRIRFTLAVSWTGSPPLEIKDIEKLPAEARLDFELDPPQTDAGEGEPEDEEGHGPAHHAGSHAEPTSEGP